MEGSTFLMFATRLLQQCGRESGAAFYALLPSIDAEDPIHANVTLHSVESMKRLIDSAIDIFTGKAQKVAKNSFEYSNLVKRKEELLQSFSKFNQLHLNNKRVTLGEDRVDIALAIMSSLYLKSFVQPIPCFLPISSTFCGQYRFWDQIDYAALRERAHTPQFNKMLTQQFSEEFFSIQLDPEVFPLIVKRRLEKEKAFEKPLQPEMLLKAMIILLGETTAQKYEVIDHALRSLMSHIGCNKYIRADIETEYLKRLELQLFEVLGAGEESTV